MPEPILDPEYWKQRLKAAGGTLHHAVFKCPIDQWLRVEKSHANILANLVLPHESILDAGCAYGRLLRLMPPKWFGGYLGVDISPDFIAAAMNMHPHRRFQVGSLLNLSSLYEELAGYKFDYAVCISMRPMVSRNLSEGHWKQMASELRCCANRILYLEYDETDQGRVE